MRITDKKRDIIICGIVTVCGYLLCAGLYGFSQKFIFNCFLIPILVAVIMIDYRQMIIPNRLITVLIIPAVVSIFVFPDISFVSRIGGFFVVSVPMFLMCCVVNGCFGGGDIKLMAVAGFMLGTRNIVLAMVIGIFLGGINAVYVLIKNRNRKGNKIAFGPALSIAIFAALNFGDYIFKWYICLF